MAEAPAGTGGAPAAGADLAREALQAAKAASRQRPARPGRADPERRRDRRTLTGSGPDSRDPQPVGSTIRRLLTDRGWEQTAQVGRVMGDWEALVGADIAGHCRPEALRDGELILVAESTAWATQLRLLAPQLVARLSAQLGPGLVRRVRVHGPAAPSWRKGPRRVVGRGPRDTYG